MDDLRRRVLDASLTLLQAEGLAALSMREVARRAGVSHQAPYHHFGDRAGILAALAGEGFAALADALEAIDAPEPATRIAAQGTAYVRFALAHPAHFRLMFRPELVDLSKWPEAGAHAARCYQALRGSVEACTAAGLVRAEETADVVAVTWSIVHGLATLLLDGPLQRSGRPPEELAERVPGMLAELLVAARRGPGGPAPQEPAGVVSGTRSAG